ncbi:RNA 3'-terminal phosphate cyclase [Kipferlia bialata]|uniref:RNA 3'-terminal phosphate cyclase n=1 Tax=Kipferlia bialata TaxID=797122 RepID=A0A9K3D275_9EUKA|nr:RNA 3'-terminal phosphate cyclase [Kipferlia bialata]|eukprot:g8801.t1
MEFEGASDFRLRVTLAVLMGRSVSIEDIHRHERSEGLRECESNFLDLVKKLSDSIEVELDDDRCGLSVHPGQLVGGALTHTCTTDRGLGYWLEMLLLLLPFCRNRSSVTLKGITNFDGDLSVDTIRSVSLPLLHFFGIDKEEVSLKVEKRGFVPNGDHSKGPGAGLSPGYGMLLTAETTSGAVLSCERWTHGKPTEPEEIGRETALSLLAEIGAGGCVDTSHQVLILCAMALCREDVSRIRLGPLTPRAVRCLRLLYTVLGVRFSLEEVVSNRKREQMEEGQGDMPMAIRKQKMESAAAQEAEQEEDGVPVRDVVVMATCRGAGYRNMSRKAI